MKAKNIRIVLIICLTAVFLFSAFNIIKITSEYKKIEKTYTELQEQFIKENDSSVDTFSDQKLVPPISIDFEALKKENNDIVGWLYCPDTPINYPVVQGKDNNQYLRADLKGKYSVGGTLFADYRNNTIGSDNNFIIYGHNMKNSTMFGTFKNYKEQAYYDTHPILYFLTPENNYIIELCAGTVIKRDSDIYQLTPQKDTIEHIISNSTFDSSVEITEETNIITLSTCSYDFKNARYVLLGKLIKI